jgi:hypothetical protein
MDTDIFFLVFFFTLILVYGMTGNKRPFGASSDRRPRNLTEKEDEISSSDRRPRNLTEREGEATSSHKRPRNLTEREGEISNSDRRPRNLTEREGEATSSDKRPRGETAEVVESTYIFLLLFEKRINISYWIGGSELLHISDVQDHVLYFINLLFTMNDVMLQEYL